MSAPNTTKWVSVGLLGLPLYGALTFWSSLNPQPDPVTRRARGELGKTPRWEIHPDGGTGTKRKQTPRCGFCGLDKLAR